MGEKRESKGKQKSRAGYPV